MPASSIAKYLTPWMFKRQQEKQRLLSLRQRDGDDCRRCRRPMRFDLPKGHDLGAKVEQILANPAGGRETLDNLCLCHARCNAGMIDHTTEVVERMRRKNEADLFAKPQRKRRKAA
ncbi:MAG TPA: hypothetical protein VF067_08980 [Sphingomicrobium sp.]